MAASPPRPMPDVPGVRHSDVSANGVRLHVAEAGEGAPLLLIHGWPQHWYEWRELIPPLAERHRVICPDLRGFGWSEAPRGPYDKETLARDMLALLDELGLDRVRVVGHDWGGWAGFLMALFAPERVERLIALNIAHPFGPSDTLRAAASMWRFWYQGAVSLPVVGPRFVRLLGTLPRHPVTRFVGGSPGPWNNEETRIFLDQFLEPDRAAATTALYRTFVLRELAWQVSGRYRRLRLTVPTRLIWSTGDQVIREPIVTGFEPYADDMTLERVPDGGHFIVDEVPELVLARVRAFMA